MGFLFSHKQHLRSLHTLYIEINGIPNVQLSCIGNSAIDVYLSLRALSDKCRLLCVCKFIVFSVSDELVRRIDCIH